MWHGLLGDARLYELLYSVDEDLAKAVKGRGCGDCDGPLHVSNYPRKPRGETLPAELAARYERRFSYCCGREGCRHRATPPSVRFLGRRVYLAAIVTLVTALRHGATGARRAALGAHISSQISRKTVARWTLWWREAFPSTRCWGVVQGLTSPPPEASRLPMSLLARVGAGEPEAVRLALVLGNLGPVTTTSCAAFAGISRVLRGAQKM